MSVVERIYSASTFEDGPAVRLAERLARRIEDHMASHGLMPGDSLGSLGDISERYSAGRAVTREAVGLLERRGLGRLRPGPRGGFIITAPRSDLIAQELADYFRNMGVSLSQLLDAREAVDRMAAGLAATAVPDAAAIARLPSCGDGQKDNALADQLTIRLEIASMTDEPVVALFVKCLNNLTLDFAGQRALSSLRGDVSPSVRANLRDAIARGDAEGAAAAAGDLHSNLVAVLEERQNPQKTVAMNPPRQTDDRTLAVAVARKLAAEIVQNGRAGQRLGSEWDLCERFSVSRLTLRRATRLLQDSGLVECRRGRGNGLLVRNRHLTGGIRLVLAFLIGKRMDPLAAGTILFQLNAFIPALAVGRAGAGQRQNLKAALARVEGRDTFDRYDLLNLVHCVSRMADSPVIDCFSRCLAAYEARFHPLLAERLPASVQAGYFDLMHRLLDAPLDNSPQALSWAKGESTRVMFEMSRSRPI